MIDKGDETARVPYALIAEFDTARATMYQQVIAETGLAVASVRDGEAARAMIGTRGAPALLVTDLSLPRTDGLTVIKLLRQTTPPEKTAVVVLSAFQSLRDLASKAQAALGINTVAEKNLTAEEFRGIVTRAVGTSFAAEPPQLPGTPEQLIAGLIERFRRIVPVPVIGVSVQVGGRRIVKAHVELTLPGDALQDANPGSLVQQVSTTRQPIVVRDARGGDACIGIPESAIRGRAAIPLLTAKGSLLGVATLFDVQPLELPQAMLDTLLSDGRAFAEELERRHGYTARIAENAEEDGGTALPPHIDPLSGLYTRPAGEQSIVREAARVRRTGYPASLALFDIDGFRKVNERHGRDAGDHILREIGRLLRSSFRQSDLSIRWGADEFLIVLSDVPLVGAALFAERVRTAVEDLGMTSNDRLTCSGAVVELGRDESPAAAIQRAETHLRAAKAAGGNRINSAIVPDSGVHEDPARWRSGARPRANMPTLVPSPRS